VLRIIACNVIDVSGHIMRIIGRENVGFYHYRIIRGAWIEAITRNEVWGCGFDSQMQQRSLKCFTAKQEAASHGSRARAIPPRRRSNHAP
jgi:hypothetical protein